MADRYWVGGAASWDGTAGTKWATTSGGAGGASVPTSADDVFFDSASGVNTVTIATGNTGAKSINCTGFTGTITGTAAITVSGSVTLSVGMTFTYTGTLTLNATGTLTSAGKTLGPVTINGSGITVTLGDALNIGANTLTLSQGTFTTSGSNYSVSVGSLNLSGSSLRTLSLNASAVTITTATAIVGTTTTNLTLNAGTSTISCTASGAQVFFGASGSALDATLYNLVFTSSTVGSLIIRGVLTVNNLSFAGPSVAGVIQVQVEGRFTINGTLSTTGTAGDRRVWIRSQTYGLAQTLTVNSAPSLTDADFRDVYVIGSAAPISGTRIGDLRGCDGVTFSPSKTVYWNLAGAQDWSANGWSDTSTGTPSTDFFPLAQDTATFTNAGSVTGNISISNTFSYTGSVDMSGRTSAMTLVLNASTPTVYGNWVNGSGTTLSGAGVLTFSGRNTQTITSAGKTFSGAITVDSYGGTVELADALNIGANTLTVTNGTFDTKNFSVTAGSLSSNNSNVREIRLGSSTVTLSAAGAVTFATSTNLTLNAGTSQITSTATAPTFAGGTGLTFYNLTFSAIGVGSTATFSGTSVFNNISVTPNASAGLVILTFQNNQTINGAFTVAGATAVRRIFLRSDALGTPRTLTVGTLSATDCDFRDITIAGTAAGSSPTRVGDCGGNTGITFPAPKTVYWNLAGTQDWSATGWAPTSGGTVDINQFPLAQDTAVFDNTGSAGTVTIDAAWNIGTMDASARTTAMTLTTSTNAPFVYGDWRFGTGVTSTSTTGTITFAGRGVEAITSNGIQFGCPITINCVTGTVQLADALSMGATRILTLASGTFDAVTYNVTTGSFSSSSVTGTLRMGTGTWTLSGTVVVWDMATTLLTLYKGTANIVLSNTSTTARTFAGNGYSYNRLTIGGATGTSTLTITGNNQFTELASTKTVAHTIALGTTVQTFGKWTVTGTVGNVVTLTGTGTSHILAGACTSGIDYLAMGSIGFAATSPGEFYAGANSTATAAVAPVYLTAKPADSTRYWVGGTGNWSDTARWSTGSGGASGASVPRSHDDVVFDAASNATAYTATVNAVTGGIRMKSLTVAGPASGNLTLAGSTAMVGIHNNVTLPATGLTRTYTGAITLSGSTTGRTLTTNGLTLQSALTVNGVDCGWVLGSSLTNSSDSLTITNGSFDTAGYTLAVSNIASDNGNTRTVAFGVSTVNINGATAISFGTTETNRANLTFTAGTSQISFSSSIPTLSGNNQTFYNVSFTTTSANPTAINGANSFNNLSFTGITAAGLKVISLTANQTVTGTLTFSAGTDATMRHFCRSDTIGTTRTITTAAASMTDVDFRDITIAGAAAPASGTRIGDCKGNSGITFTAAANKYWNLAAGGNWSATGWALTSGGSPAVNNFPLAQDTCFFEATGLNSGATVTINAAYNIGTIDMSARTANTMTLAVGSQTPTSYGNWINGTGTTLTGAGILTFAGRSSQTITSAGSTFTQGFRTETPGGSVTLQDALNANLTTASAFVIAAGTFDANGYNATFAGGASSATSAVSRVVAIGSGTFVVGGTTGWNMSAATNLTVTGTGTISLTSASAKTFAGGNIAYTNITLNQGGAGALTITGNNTFKDITNTYKATGATNITMGATTQQVSQWTAAGEVGRLLTIQGTSAASPATLIYTGGSTVSSDYLTITGVRAYPLTSTWSAGTNSTNNGSLGWSFTAGAGQALYRFFYFF